MRIDFFEEFPEDGELEKARLIDFPSTIYIAAESVEEYRQYKRELEEINPDVEAAYWPIADNSYWVSPFSNQEDLENFFSELRQLEEEKVLVDVERPLGEWSMYLRNLWDFRANKNLIREFLADAGGSLDVMTAEMPGIPFLNRFRQLLGTCYSSEDSGHERCPMYYTSMQGAFKNYLNRMAIAREAEKGEELAVGLGTIATGVLGDEPILSPEELDRDLRFVSEQGLDRAVIFRLGGLDGDYLEVIEKYVG